MNMFFALLALIVAACAPAPAFAQQQVFQSGNVTPGHAAAWTANGIIQDAGSAASPALSGWITGMGIVGQGPTLCFYSAPVSSAGWQRMCFGVNQSSAAQISIQNFGTATPQGIQFLINGAAAALPTITTPGVIGDAVCYQTTAGQLNDCGAPPLTGALTSAFFFVGNGSNVATGVAMSGDAALANTGAVTVSKTGGVTFAPSATTDTTNAANISAGTLPPGRMPALTGDVTSSSGTVATAIAAGAVTNAKRANMASNTISGNATGSPAAPTDLTTQQLAGINYPNLVAGTTQFGPWRAGIAGCGNPTWYATGTTAGGIPISNASPAVVSWNSHAQEVGMPVYFSNNADVLPSPLQFYTPYYVIAAGLGANSFEVSATAGGAAINTTTVGSGSHVIHSDCIATITTPAGTSANTIYRLEATGGGAGGCPNKGGGGAGGYVEVTISGIPAGTVLLDVIGAAGHGCNADASPRAASNGTQSAITCRDTVGTCVAGLTLLATDFGHFSTTVSAGRGANPSGCSGFISLGTGPCIIQASVNIQGGGDGSMAELNGSMGGVSYWGGGDQVASGNHGQGAGGGYNALDQYGYDGFLGNTFVTCVYACW